MNEKFIKKSLLFVVKQPGAGRLEFYWPNASSLSTLAYTMMWQSFISCGKPVLRGDSNPSSKEQIVYFNELAKKLGL